MIKKKVTVEWLKKLIGSGNTAPFYNTKEWGKIRNKKLQAEHFECERCRAKGRYKKGTTVHHKKYLRQYPELALNFDNLEVLCEDCHYDEHHRKKEINSERW